MLTLLLLACAPKEPPPPPPVPAGEPGQAELVTEGPLSARVSTAAADLVLFYGGEHQGSIETCGCPNRPRGSLTRMRSYLDASRAANPGTPDLVLHGGYWLEDATDFDGGLRPDVPVMNRWMLAGLEAVGVDAVNTTFHDLPGLVALDAAPPWAVSANVVAAGEGAVAPARWRIVERGGLKIGVTGITARGATLGETGGLRVEDPYAPGLAALQELAPQVDLLVLMAYQSPEIARDLAAAVPELDVVIDTAMHRSFYEPVVVGDALWLRSHYQTMRLGELRLARADDGWALVVDRRIDLDPEVPDAPEMAALVTASRDELEAVQKALYGDKE
ncbi:MAG: hypothetical protein H6739_25685 [Alphaproteobacteria bacterium]|nr:hypothetical protein [Alphaproteobacteria bacterium]